MTSANEETPAPAGDHPPHFAMLMDLAWRAFRRELDERLGPRLVDLPAAGGAQFRPSHGRLLSLTPEAGMRVTDLAARVGMTKQALGEFVTTLQQAGLLEVTVDQRDRRVRLVRPTPAGRRVQQAIQSAIDEVEHHWKAAVGPHRWATFLKVLTEIGVPRPSNGQPQDGRSRF